MWIHKVDQEDYRMDNMKPEVRVLAEFPLSIAFGGLELQCLRTLSALQKKISNIAFLDYHNADEEFDILHIFGNPAGLYEVVFHAAKSKKVIISAVCGAIGFSPFRRNVQRAISGIANIVHQRTDYARLRSMFQAAAHVICLNELEKDFIARTYQLSPSKLTIIPIGVEEYYFSASPGSFVDEYGMTDFVLYTGNIVGRKNPLRLAAALKKVGLGGVFIGSVLNAELEYASHFEEIISRSPNLLWIKGLPYDDPLLASAYAAASIFCLPSSGETQSASAMEAMAAGTPIILGDLPYAYQPPFEKALRCSPDHEGSIEECIKQILQAPDEYSQKLPESFTWGNAAAKIAKVYEKVRNS